MPAGGTKSAFRRDHVGAAGARAPPSSPRRAHAGRSPPAPSGASGARCRPLAPRQPVTITRPFWFSASPMASSDSATAASIKPQVLTTTRSAPSYDGAMSCPRRAAASGCIRNPPTPWGSQDRRIQLGGQCLGGFETHAQQQFSARSYLYFEIGKSKPADSAMRTTLPRVPVRHRQ